jgi:hypothetical protein
VHDVRPGVDVGMGIDARACWVAERGGMRVRQRREGGKRVRGEEDDADKREAGRSRRERHGFPDLRVLACERRTRTAKGVREAGMDSVRKRERRLRR